MSKQELIEKAVIDLNGELPDHKNEHYAIAGNVIHRPFFPRRESLVCTIDEFNAAADRMRGKPDWSTLPAKAEWLAQDRCGIWKPMQGRKPTIEEGSYWITDHHLQPQPRGTVIGDWRNTLEKRPEQSKPLEADRFGIMPPVNKNEGCSMPALAKPWFEAGELPPVGVKVEAVIELKHEECEVIAYFEDMAWLSVGGSKRHPVRIIEACKFRPIKTDKEKAIEAADAVIRKTSSAVDDVALNALYDAGLLRLPDNKKPG